jgi:hypothetical protein
MSYHTQNEIAEKWDRLRNGDDMDGSRIVTDEGLEQALTIVMPARYNDSNDGNAYVAYIRKRLGKNAPRGTWEEVT